MGWEISVPEEHYDRYYNTACKIVEILNQSGSRAYKTRIAEGRKKVEVVTGGWFGSSKAVVEVTVVFRFTNKGNHRIEGYDPRVLVHFKKPIPEFPMDRLAGELEQVAEMPVHFLERYC